MSWIATAAVIAAISAVIGGYSVYQSGQAQSAQAKYQGALAERNAEIERMNAEAARGQTEYERQKRLKEAETLLSKQRNLIASGGGTLDEGTGLLIQTETAAQLSRDEDMLLYKGEMAARGYDIRALSNEGQSPLFYMQSDAAGRGSVTGSLGTILGGISQAAGYYGKAQSGTTVSVID